jgi:diguanylate cyclase (GGDEF)-like protein
VLNRRGFLSRAEAELAADREAGHPTALLMFDIDHFKRINDCWGHEAGDRALVAFCRVASAQLGPSALFGRIGGEEFACIIKGGDEGWARRAAERVRVALAAAPIDLGGPLLLPTTVSAGVASTAAGRSDVSALMAGADEALYRAKSLGRNRVEGSSRGSAEPRLMAA